MFKTSRVVLEKEAVVVGVVVAAMAAVAGATVVPEGEAVADAVAALSGGRGPAASRAANAGDGRACATGVSRLCHRRQRQLRDQPAQHHYFDDIPRPHSHPHRPTLFRFRVASLGRRRYIFPAPQVPTMGAAGRSYGYCTCCGALILV